MHCTRTEVLYEAGVKSYLTHRHFSSEQRFHQLEPEQSHRGRVKGEKTSFRRRRLVSLVLDPGESCAGRRRRLRKPGCHGHAAPEKQIVLPFILLTMFLIVGFPPAIQNLVIRMGCASAGALHRI